jgi:hypothetical protein
MTGTNPSAIATFADQSFGSEFAGFFVIAGPFASSQFQRSRYTGVDV